MKARQSSDPSGIALDATLRRAARATGSLSVLPEHLMEKVRVTSGRALYVILLDSSSSMRMDRKIRFAKSLSWHLLKQSYENRNRVALLVFRGAGVDLEVSPTADMERINRALESIPTGGKTPMTPALIRAIEISGTVRDARPVIVLISDGKGNVYARGSLEEDLAFIVSMKEDFEFIAVNAETKNRSIGILEEVAAALGGSHYHLEEIL